MKMMKWLRKKREKEEREIDPRVVNMLVRCRSILNRWAERLQVKMNGFSFRLQKIILACFCLLLAGASVFVAVASFQKRNYRYHSVDISLMPLVKENKSRVALPWKELTRIHQFKVYIDSLNRDERIRLLAGRPHLMDTVNYLESLYQKEINTK